MTNKEAGTVILGVPVEDIQDDTQYIGIEQLQHLVRLVDQSDIGELEVKHSGTKARLLLRKSSLSSDEMVSTEGPSQSTEAASPAETNDDQMLYTVTAPCVGLFQSWARTKDKPLVAVGDTVQQGQYLCVVRSMDIPSEVEAPVVGRVVEILVQNGQPVEYGQALMTISRQ